MTLYKDIVTSKLTEPVIIWA